MWLRVRTLTKLRFDCSARNIVMKTQISSDMQISCLDYPNPPPPPIATKKYEIHTDNGYLQDVTAHIANWSLSLSQLSTSG